MYVLTWSGAHLVANSSIASYCGRDNTLPGIRTKPWNRPAVNVWRTRAKGKWVLAAPVWLYCDDTSGNTSKKWNKHNSILFTLAGLPRSHVQLFYNVHFIATSNIASPLEMAEYVCDVLQ